MDALFKALGDPTRRMILDRLRERDGLTLTELEAGTGMTRFGVMKHLKVLEEAHLITARKAGRFKHHHLNVLPLTEAMERWIEPLTQGPQARAILTLKRDLERDSKQDSEGETDMTVNDPKAPTPDEAPDFVMETYIRATPERVWEALTTAEVMTHYHFAGAGFRGKVEAGEDYALVRPGGGVMLSGRILEARPFAFLAMTFVPGWEDAPEASRNTYEITPVGGSVKLRVAHYDLPARSGIRDGWVKVLSALKTYLETGESLDVSEEAA